MAVSFGEGGAVRVCLQFDRQAGIKLPEWQHSRKRGSAYLPWRKSDTESSNEASRGETDRKKLNDRIYVVKIKTSLFQCAYRSETMESMSKDLLRGYVTTYRAVAGRSHAELADVLGFAPGTLSNGYRVYQLCEAVGPNDFEWKDRTRYSDGWHFDRTIGEHVQRSDEMRAHLGKQHAYDEQAVDHELGAFQAKQLLRLNMRSGPERIVKIVPDLEEMSYPDSPFHDIPQWRLKNRKQFVLIGRSV